MRRAVMRMRPSSGTVMKQPISVSFADFAARDRVCSFRDVAAADARKQMIVRHGPRLLWRLAAFSAQAHNREALSLRVILAAVAIFTEGRGLLHDVTVRREELPNPTA
jgi:hypothetical protein